MKMNKLIKLCMMVAVVAIVFGVYASTSYGQETSTTDETIAPTNPLPPYVNVGMGYKIGERVVLAEPGGYSNIALGENALNHNTFGNNNTASGIYALYSNTSGEYNAASGTKALWSNTTGANNTASGNAALQSNTIGVDNTAFGNNACSNLSTGSNVICIGSDVGPAGDIAGPATYIGGIYGAPTTGAGNPLVCIDSTGLLGTTGCAATDMIESLQKQNEELRERVARLEALIAKK
jgi:hypothetical protein